MAGSLATSCGRRTHVCIPAAGTSPGERPAHMPRGTHGVYWHPLEPEARQAGGPCALNAFATALHPSGRCSSRGSRGEAVCPACICAPASLTLAEGAAGTGGQGPLSSEHRGAPTRMERVCSCASSAPQTHLSSQCWGRNPKCLGGNTDYHSFLCISQS